MQIRNLAAAPILLFMSLPGCQKKDKTPVTHGIERPEAFANVTQVVDSGFDQDLVVIEKDWLLRQSFSMSISTHDGDLTRQTSNVLQGRLVRFELNGGRLFLLERPEGRATHSNYPSLLITSFPVLKVNSSKTKIQVDFSAPEDREFVSILLKQTPEWRTTALQALTPALPMCNEENLTAFHCLNGSADLAIRYNMRAIKTAKPSPNLESENESEVGSGHIFYLGLSPTTEVEPSASTLKLSDATAKMFGSGAVTDATHRSNVTPFFLTEDIQGSPTGAKQSPFQAVRRYDTSKPIEFVISESTPASMVPVIKSAVMAYARAFDAMGIQNKGIFAYSTEEFKSLHPEFTIIEAADPRISVIDWNNDGNIGSAWATAAAHPFTGLVKSADVFMTGSMWSMAGCRYQVLNTAVLSKPADRLSPSPELAAKATEVCEKVLSDLGILTKNSSLISTASSGQIARAEELYEPLLEVDFSKAQTLAQKTLKPRSGVDCYRDIDTSFSDLGGAIPEGLSAISPELAAKSLVRAVLIHELGHTFGLRHNFIASQTPGKMKTPIPTSPFTDSVMDYVLYGFEIVDHAEALKTPDGYKDHTGLGSYDLVALAVAYGGDLARITVENPSKFCTDEDTIDPLSPCQRYDFGKNISQFIQFGVAKSIRRLQIAGLPLDLSGGRTLVKNLAVEQGKLWLSFLSTYAKASTALNEKTRLEALPELLNLGFGRPTTTTEPWWNQFETIHGGTIPSLLENLNMSPSKFENDPELLRKVDRDLITLSSLNGFISAGEAILAARTKIGEKSLSPLVPKGFKAGDQELNIDKLIAKALYEKIVLPVGTIITLTSLTGAEQQFQLDVDFFNHQANAITKTIDGIEYKFIGQSNLNIMESSAKALSLLANGYASSPSALILDDLNSRLRPLVSQRDPVSSRVFPIITRMMSVIEELEREASATWR